MEVRDRSDDLTLTTCVSVSTFRKKKKNKNNGAEQNRGEKTSNQTKPKKKVQPQDATAVKICYWHQATSELPTTAATQCVGRDALRKNWEGTGYWVSQSLAADTGRLAISHSTIYSKSLFLYFTGRTIRNALKIFLNNLELLPSK